MRQELAIQVGDEFLDLAPGTTMQLEEDNPFLQLTDQILGPYSLPFIIPHSEKNIRLLNLISAIYTDKTLISYPAIIWENGIQHSIGTLKVEQVNGNLNDLKSGNSSLYYLTGTSSFYDLVKDKKLGDLDWGGDRTFSGLTGVDYNRTIGFGKHLTDLFFSLPGAFDYSMFPVKNDNWLDDTGTFKAFFLNSVSTNGEYNLRGAGLNSAHTPLVPFPYLKYVLTGIFTQLGYTLKGNILTDANFIKICLIAFRDILYCNSRVLSDGTSVLKMKPTVTFNLKSYMPDVTIAEFLIALKNRFGWYYDFDLNSKTCTIEYLKDVIGGQFEDITPLVNASYLNKIDLAGKIYALTQTFDSGDTFPGAPDLTGRTFLGNFNTAILIPPTEAIEGNYVFLERENAFYICRASDNDVNVYIWALFSDNIYDYSPDGNNESINTAATPMAQEHTSILNNQGNPVMTGIFLRADQQGIWQGKYDDAVSWGIRLAFYHGPHLDDNAHTYPYASNHPIDNQGNLLGDWALSYEFSDIGHGHADGLYNVFWKGFLARLKQNETFTITARYPFSDKNNIRFGDSKVIQHTRFFIKKKTTIIPYNGSLQLDLIKV